MSSAAFTRSGFVTSTGIRVCLDDPWGSDVRPTDIVLSLSRQCRFGGHLRPDVEHYSVAQHSVLVSHLCHRSNALIGLLHDATEAFVQDMIRPMKRLMVGSGYKELEHLWALRLGEVFKLGAGLACLPDDVNAADQIALVTEIRDVYYGDIAHETTGYKPDDERIMPLGPKNAYRLFQDRLRQLAPEIELMRV